MAAKAHIGSARQGGFTLVETLLGLTMIGLGLLFAFAAMLQHGQAVKRLNGHERALRALDTKLESLRGGADSDLLVGRPTTDDDGQTSTGGSGDQPVVIVLTEIVPASPNGLYRVSLTARYAVAGRAYERRLESLLWRPTP